MYGCVGALVTHLTTVGSYNGILMIYSSNIIIVIVPTAAIGDQVVWVVLIAVCVHPINLIA